MRARRPAALAALVALGGRGPAPRPGPTRRSLPPPPTDGHQRGRRRRHRRPTRHVGVADPTDHAPTTRPPGRPPWLIKHGWDIPRPDFVEQNVAAMEQRGFDGVVIQIPSSGDVLSQQPVGYEQTPGRAGAARRAPGSRR